MLSRAEVAALTLKAARGAGLPVGLAEDFSRAAVELMSSAPQDAPDIVRALEPFDRTPDVTEDGDTLVLKDARCAFAVPISVDALQAGSDRVIVDNLDAPALFHAAMCLAGRDIGRSFVCACDGSRHVVTTSAQPLSVVGAVGPVNLSDAVSQRLNALAALTFVPDSAASRTSGAGGAED